ncbi:hypothetical protein [Microbacterium sp. G2-8]|uniref:hypothetical protein n=1 Tax=Microbacterium sp. G2-8 TaxID=2842454 RepID=UPI001C8987B3|nr:hypothetical protein [Microbacterium sp. G2-8]
MNATNRIANRALLLVTGVILLAAGTAAIIVATRPAWGVTVVDAAGSWAASLAQRTVDVPVVGAMSTLAAVGFGAAALIGAGLIAFLATRGGGRMTTVVHLAGRGGDTIVDDDVAEALLTEPLRVRPEILAARTTVYRIQRAPAIRLAVTVRRGASLSRVLATIDSAVSEWDALAGTHMPIVVHLSDRGWWSTWRADVRVR